MKFLNENKSETINTSFIILAYIVGTLSLMAIVAISVVCFVMVFLSGEAKAEGIDLRGYFPTQYADNTLVNWKGEVMSRFVFKEGPKTRTGRIMYWEKSYPKPYGYRVATTATLHYGNDKSIMEIGDTMPTWRAKKEHAKYFGYTKDGKPSGLPWSGKGGLKKRVTISGLDVNKGNSRNSLEYAGMQVYSTTQLLEILPVYTLEHGNQRIYTDVVHIIMYHGGKFDGRDVEIDCSKEKVHNHDTVPYRHKPGYITNGIELWLAKGVGIIKHRKPWAENEKGHRGNDECMGYRFSNKYEDSTNYLM